MVLLKKNDSPAGLRDYRPISLVHSIGKLFSKGLAMRLAPRMHELVRLNQSAFIRGRQIHENFRSVQLTCRWLHNRRCPSILLKIDLAKAFDSVAWPFLLEVLQHAGFPARWRDWLSTLLATASTKVLVNGRPGRRIRHAASLRDCHGGTQCSNRRSGPARRARTAAGECDHQSMRMTSSSSFPRTRATSSASEKSYNSLRARRGCRQIWINAR